MGDVDVASGTTNPPNECEQRDGSVSTTSWTNDDFWPCNDVSQRNGNTDSPFCD